MRVTARLITMATLALLTSGCAATLSTVHLGKANKAVLRAKERGAEEYAVYEYTMAENYLQKAREESNYSDYRDSIELSRGAAEWADKAIIVIEKEGRDLNPDALPGETRVLTDEDRLTNEKSGESQELPDELDLLPEAPDDDLLQEAPDDDVPSETTNTSTPPFPKPEFEDPKPTPPDDAGTTAPLNPGEQP